MGRYDMRCSQSEPQVEQRKRQHCALGQKPLRAA